MLKTVYAVRAVQILKNSFARARLRLHSTRETMLYRPVHTNGYLFNEREA